MKPPIEPESGDYWDAVAGGWRTAHEDLWRRHSDSVNRALCQRWLPARVHRLLKTDAFDEASSLGLFPWLTGVAERVETIDVSPVVAARARARHTRLSATVSDVRRLPFADGVFDAVVSNSTLDHFPDAESIEESVKELHRVLMPGGRLLITLDNAANPVVALRNVLPYTWLRRLGLVPYFVGATLGPSTLPALLGRVGFEVVDVTAILHCPRVLAVPAARVASRVLEPTSRASFLSALSLFELAERWPTRFLTGHFVAAVATRRAD